MVIWKSPTTRIRPSLDLQPKPSEQPRVGCHTVVYQLGKVTADSATHFHNDDQSSLANDSPRRPSPAQPAYNLT